MTLTDLAPDDSGEHDALDTLDDTELAARFGPLPTVYYLDRRDPAARAAGWLFAIVAGLTLWLALGLAALLALD